MCIYCYCLAKQGILKQLVASADYFAIKAVAFIKAAYSNYQPASKHERLKCLK
jgi:hypothetical protein